MSAIESPLRIAMKAEGPSEILRRTIESSDDNDDSRLKLKWYINLVFPNRNLEKIYKKNYFALLVFSRHIYLFTYHTSSRGCLFP